MATQETISDRLRSHGQGLIVGFPEGGENSVDGKRVETLEAYFFRVAEVQDMYIPYDQVGMDDGLTSGESLDFNYLGDDGLGAGDDVLRVGEDDFHMYHFGVVPQDPALRMYYTVSPSSESNDALSRRGREFPDPLDTDARYRGYMTRGMSPSIYDPGADTERVSFRNDKDGEFLQFGFYAEDDITEEGSTLHIVGRGYKVHPVTEESVQDKMLETVTAQDDEADIPTVLTQVGGLSTYNLGTETPDGWDSSFKRKLDYSNVGV